MESISSYDYDLPGRLIAQTPLAERSASRLLHLMRDTGEVVHRMFRDVPQLLREGDLLVMNETRVSAIRLLGRKATGGAVEALLLRETAPGRFQSLLRASRCPRPGTRLEFGDGLSAITGPSDRGGEIELTFRSEGPLRERLDTVGLTPLPPYIHTPLADRERYQTVYGRVEGSAASPTAGLHFTSEILEELAKLGVRFAKVTLHVGTDTFRPVNADDPADHVMTGESCSVPPETAEMIASATGRVIAVGTTTVRTLESFATGRRRLSTGEMTSRLFIRPGFEFKIADGMFTNFHMPRTTMLMMISALAGREAIMKAYASAVENGYRFLSFGDSMLIL